MRKIPLVVIAGPTASGKTTLSVEVANMLNSEIVSADSVQVYKYLNIGSAKPTEEEKQGVVHHLMDEIDPMQEFSVADYTQLAHECILKIHESGKIPVMVGGTGLYINSVVDDVEFGEVDTDEVLRKELTEVAQQKGGEHLLNILSEFDEVSAKRLHPNNVRRIVRAIEFYRLTGMPISKHQEITKQRESRYDSLIFALDWNRQVLYNRIDKRVDIMMNDGLIDEVQDLKEKGYTKELSSMKGIGYKEVFDYLDSVYTYDELLEVMKRESRRYAKRQLTWFRRDERIHWISPEDEPIQIIIDAIKQKRWGI